MRSEFSKIMMHDSRHNHLAGAGSAGKTECRRSLSRFRARAGNETVSRHPGIHLAFTARATKSCRPASRFHSMKLLCFSLLLAAAVARAAVTPSTLNRSRTATSVTITATGTAATLDGAPFPLGVATAVTAIGFHDLVVTDTGVTTSYKFIVRNSERGSTEDGIPTMKPYRLIMDAPGAFADSTLNLMAPAVYPKNLPIPVVARLTKGATFGATAGDPHFLNARVHSQNFPADPILVRRGWGSTILAGATAATSTAYDGSANGRAASAPVTIENTTTWTTKTGALPDSTALRNAL